LIYESSQLLLIAVILTAGAVVQGAVGFASGLISIPLLVLAGFPIQEAATVNLVSTSVQNVAGAWRLWDSLEPRELVFPVLVRWLGIPLGVMALGAAQTLSPAQAKQLIGLLLLAVVVLLGMARPAPRHELGRGISALAFLSSGFLLGFASIGGAPLVLYVNALTWSAAQSRAFLFFCSASGVPVVAVLFALRFGTTLVPPMVAALIAMPAIGIGLWCGLRWGGKLDKRVFRRLTIGLLVLLAITSIAGPWIGLLR
jgi:uncharacterized membrane protein YfcA